VGFQSAILRDHSGGRLGPPHIAKRVEIAKTLLSETNSPLVGVAAQTGFSDQAAFTRAFANVVGATPAKWRREHSRRGSFVEVPKLQFSQPQE